MVFVYSIRVFNSIIRGVFQKVPVVKPPPGTNKKAYYDLTFRTYPVDLDFYWHTNNACYFRMAELARWRIFPQSRSLHESLSKGWMLLIAQQSIKYYKSIGPFQKFVIRTSMQYTQDKWLHYSHTFLQHPDDVARGKDPATFAHIQMKAVIKDRGGKTIKPSEFVQISDFNQQLISEGDAVELEKKLS